MSIRPEIYFHVGLGKVASTYLQHQFFPKLEEICYLPANQFHRAEQRLSASASNKWLVSREFDRQYEHEVRKFTTRYPQTRIIIVLRPHASWIASQYRRYVKNGRYHSFDKFVDMDNDLGFWKQDDLLYYPKIKLAEELTGNPPLVLFYDELRKAPRQFLDRIANFCNTSYSFESISQKPEHTSFSDKQLLVLRSFCRRYVKKVPRGRAGKLANWIYFRPWWAFFHLILYSARYLPWSLVPKEELISQDSLKHIDSIYRSDWEQVVNYAMKNNPT